MIHQGLRKRRYADLQAFGPISYRSRSCCMFVLHNDCPFTLYYHYHHHIDRVKAFVVIIAHNLVISVPRRLRMRLNLSITQCNSASR